MQFGGLNYTVPLGRRDGVSSFAWEANNNLPPPFADFNMLMSLFSAKGLTTKDMVVLSGKLFQNLVLTKDWSQRFDSRGIRQSSPKTDSQCKRCIHCTCPHFNEIISWTVHIMVVNCLIHMFCRCTHGWVQPLLHIAATTLQFLLNELHRPVYRPIFRSHLEK